MNFIFKRIALILLSLFIVLSVFSADKKLVIGNNRSDLFDTAWKQIADKYTSKTGIKVEFEKWNHNDEIRTRFAGGQMPDIFMFLTDTFKPEDWPNIFVPLDDLKFVKDFREGMTSGYVYKGKLYGIGQTMSFDGLVYNKSVFKNLGIKEPKNETEFFAALDKIKKSGKIPYTFIPAAGWTMQQFIIYVQAFNMANGGSSNPRNDAAKINNPFTKDSAWGKAAFMVFKIAKNYTGNDPMSLSWDNCKPEIAKGNIAMTCFGSWFPPQVEEQGAKPGEIGLLPLPIANKKGETIANVGFDWRFGVYKKSSMVKEAKDFLNFLFGDKEAYAIWMNNFGKTSVLKSVPHTAAFMKDYSMYNPKIIIGDPDNSDYLVIKDKAQFDYQKFGNEIIACDTEADLLKLLDEYNRAWAKARKDLGKK